MSQSTAGHSHLLPHSLSLGRPLCPVMYTWPAGKDRTYGHTHTHTHVMEDVIVNVMTVRWNLSNPGMEESVLISEVS